MSEFPPVFIGGAGRSGTTLVVDMLGLHPRLSPVYETDFVLQLARLLFGSPRPAGAQLHAEVLRCMEEWSRPLPLRPHNKRPHERYFHGPHYILFDRPFALERTRELLNAIGRAGGPPAPAAETAALPAFRSFVLALFDEHARRDRKPHWINKTPGYVQYLPLLRALFPAMRFIHCVRDGRDVACSVVTRPWGPSNYPDAADWWVKTVRQGVEFETNYPGQCLVVRFEDLVREPARQLSRMLTWLGEEGDPEVILNPYRDETGISLDQDRIGEWERAFAPEDKQAFEQRAGKTLAHFGYAV